MSAKIALWQTFSAGRKDAVLSYEAAYQFCASLCHQLRSLGLPRHLTYCRTARWTTILPPVAATSLGASNLFVCFCPCSPRLRRPVIHLVHYSLFLKMEKGNGACSGVGCRICLLSTFSESNFLEAEQPDHSLFRCHKMYARPDNHSSIHRHLHWETLLFQCNVDRRQHQLVLAKSNRCAGSLGTMYPSSAIAESIDRGANDM